MIPCFSNIFKCCRSSSIKKLVSMKSLFKMLFQILHKIFKNRHEVPFVMACHKIMFSLPCMDKIWNLPVNVCFWREILVFFWRKIRWIFLGFFSHDNFWKCGNNWMFFDTNFNHIPGKLWCFFSSLAQACTHMGICGVRCEVVHSFVLITLGLVVI